MPQATAKAWKGGESRGTAQFDLSGLSPTVHLPSRFEASNSTGEAALLNSSMVRRSRGGERSRPAAGPSNGGAITGWARRDGLGDVWTGVWAVNRYATII